MAIDDTLNRTPRKNSFGDAAAAMSNPNVTQVQTAAPPTPQSAAARMAALPGAAPATPTAPSASVGTSAREQMSTLPGNQPTAPKPISPTNIFPQGHPSAGSSPYASAPATVPSAREQMATPPGAAVASLNSRVSQIPTGGMKAPAPDGSQNDPLNTDIGRNARNAMMALPGIGGLPRVASIGGAISSGLNAASSGINAASRMMTLAAGPAPAPAQAASNPYANVTPEQGRAMSEINAKAQMMDLSSAPTPYAPVQQPRSPAAIAMETTSDIKREGNSYSGTNVSGDFTINGQAPSSGGQISTKKMSAAEAMMAPLHMSGNQGTSFQPGTSTSTPHSGNSWSAANALRNLEGAASSITNQPGRWSSFGGRNGQSPAAQAYSEAVKADIALRTGNDPMALGAQREQGATQREGMQQAGSTARARMMEMGQSNRFNQTQGLARDKFGLEKETQSFATRAAAQKENLTNVLLDPNATPEQRRIAQRSLSALSGKTAADRMQTVALPDTTTDTGQVVRGGQALVRTLEDGTVEQVPIGGRGGPAPISQNQQAIEIKNNNNLSLEQKRAALKKLGYD